MSYDEDDEESDGAERESPDASDMDEGEQVRCPFCGAWVYEDAGICRQCGNYFSEEELAGRTPVWIIVGVIVCLAVVVFLWMR